MGGPANRLITRLRGRALKSVTPHQFFSNPSLHSVEETDIDTGQKTTKVLFGETNLDEVRGSLKAGWQKDAPMDNESESVSW